MPPKIKRYLRAVALVAVVFATPLLHGCKKAEQPSLEGYSHIITSSDLRSFINYPGNIESDVSAGAEAVRLRFGTEEFFSSGEKEGDLILSLDIERMAMTPEELESDLAESERVEGIGSGAWYSSFDDGFNSLIFYVRDTSITVELDAYSEGSTKNPSTWMGKEKLSELAATVYGRL